jgi:hypothetical protein
MRLMRRTRRLAWTASAMAAALLSALPAGAGELRVLLEGETGVRNDGNLQQVGSEAGLNPQAQNVARAGLDLQLSYNARERFDLALGYSPSYERSLDDARLAGATHRLDLGLRTALTRRTDLDVRERLLSTPGLDLYAPVVTQQTFAATQRGRELFHSLDAVLKDRVTPRTTLELGLNHSLRRYSLGGLSDARTVGGTLGASVNFDRERAFEVNAGVQRFTWENDNESNVETLLAAYTHPIGRSTRLRLEGGAFHVEQLQNGHRVPLGGSQGSGTKTGWRGGVELSRQQPLVQWNVGYRHDVAPGYGVERAVAVDNGFLGVSTHFGHTLTLGLDGNASRQRDLESGVSTGVTGASGSEPLTDFAAGTLRFSWAFFPSIQLTGGYSHIWQRSRVKLFDDLSYNRYFLGLAFRIYRSGEKPRAPEELERRGEPTDADAKPVAR